MEAQEQLHLLTPRERDVYDVLRTHPDWSKAQISRAVYLPPHVVRRYLENIKTKLAGLPPFSGIEVEVLSLLAEGWSHAEIARSIGIDERTVAVILRRIDQEGDNTAGSRRRRLRVCSTGPSRSSREPGNVIQAWTQSWAAVARTGPRAPQPTGCRG